MSAMLLQLVHLETGRFGKNGRLGEPAILNKSKRQVVAFYSYVLNNSKSHDVPGRARRADLVHQN